MKFICVLVLLAIASSAGMKSTEAAGECGSTPANTMALKLAPCASASQDVNAKVPSQCCSAVHDLGRNPACLCAVMLSDTAKNAGVKPEVAMTIPKRCNFADRPIGYKCGGYTLP